MTIRSFITVDNLSGAKYQVLDEGQKTPLLRALSTGSSLFGGQLATTYKVGVKRAKSITVYLLVVIPDLTPVSLMWAVVEV